MKFSAILSAGLLAIAPASAAIANQADQFTFTLPGRDGLNSPIGTMTINLSEAAKLSDDTDPQGPATDFNFLLKAVEDQVPDFISAASASKTGSVANSTVGSHEMPPCDRTCCLLACVAVIWIPIIGPACITACLAAPP